MKVVSLKQPKSFSNPMKGKESRTPSQVVMPVITSTATALKELEILPLPSKAPAVEIHFEENVAWYVDAACGGGKTLGVIEHIHRQMKGPEPLNNLYLIVVPTRKLAAQYDKELRGRNIPTQKIVTEAKKVGKGKSLTERIFSFMELGPSKRILGLSGRALVITQKAFEALPLNHPELKKWHVVYDEVPITGVHHYQLLNLPQTKVFMKRYFENLPDLNFLPKEIVFNKENIVKALRDPDTNLKDCKRLFDLVLSDKFNFIGVAAKGSKYSVLGLVKPESFLGYKSLIFLSANFKESLIYYHFLNSGITFKEHEGVLSAQFTDKHTKQLTKIKKDHGEKGKWLDIFYCEEHKLQNNGTYTRSMYSKRRSESFIEESGTTCLNTYYNHSKKIFGEDPFIFSQNKDADLDRNEQDNGVIIKTHSHGLNVYSHFNNYLHLPAMRLTSDAMNLMAWAGFTEEQLYIAMNCEPAYQNVCRTGLRNSATDDRRYKVVVPDRTTAEFLQSKFPGSTLKHVSGRDPLNVVVSPFEAGYRMPEEKLKETIKLVTGVKGKGNGVIHQGITYELNKYKLLDLAKGWDKLSASSREKIKIPHLKNINKGRFKFTEEEVAFLELTFLA